MTSANPAKEAECVRHWWRNCAREVDDEILNIDKMEEEIAPLRPEVVKVRELISRFELCHHKAHRWLDNILAAIATGTTTKGLGTRPAGQIHPAERVWQDACTALSEWCAGQVAPESRLGTQLGERTPLKEWQVQRVIERIQSVIHWRQSDDDPVTRYERILLSASDYEAAYCKHCPAQYLDYEDFWLATVQTTIHDTVDGREAELSLGLAIDMLWPCNWNFLENLQIVIDAIGGQLHPSKPFATCGRNLTCGPGQEQWTRIAATLRVFGGEAETSAVDVGILAVLGQPTQEKRWLAASLAKTIRLQLNPPAEIREESALAGLLWIA